MAAFLPPTVDAMELSLPYLISMRDCCEARLSITQSQVWDEDGDPGCAPRPQNRCASRASRMPTAIMAAIGSGDVAGIRLTATPARAPAPKRNVPASAEAVPALAGKKLRA